VWESKGNVDWVRGEEIGAEGEKVEDGGGILILLAVEGEETLLELLFEHLKY
jgi:hypothetical protein